MCGKRGNCLFWAILHFVTMFSKVVCCRCGNKHHVSLIIMILYISVFSMEGPGGHYSLYSLSDAEQVCTSNGAIIADREDLLTARAMGLDQCNCGFMSDGSTGFVMQNPNWRCWGSFSTDILSCEYIKYYVNVWCKLPDWSLRTLHMLPQCLSAYYFSCIERFWV